MERNAIDLKKEKLRYELAKPEHLRNNTIIRRLEESIKRHKKWGRPKKFFKFKAKNKRTGVKKQWK